MRLKNYRSESTNTFAVIQKALAAHTVREEIFLPSMLDRHGQTSFEALERTQFRLAAGDGEAPTP
jgi:hypothetical protein